MEQLILIEHENHLKSRFSSDFFKQIPEEPGIYRMLGGAHEVLYIGKAKNLRNRLKSYRVPGQLRLSTKTRRLLFQVREITWEVLSSESEALTKEMELIRSLKPPFNIVGNQQRPSLRAAYSDADEGLHLQLHTDEAKLEGMKVLGNFRGVGFFPRLSASLLRQIFTELYNHTRWPGPLLRPRIPWSFLIPWPETLTAESRTQTLLNLEAYFSGERFAYSRQLISPDPFLNQIWKKDQERLAEFYLRNLFEFY